MGKYEWVKVEKDIKMQEDFFWRALEVQIIMYEYSSTPTFVCVPNLGSMKFLQNNFTCFDTCLVFNTQAFQDFTWNQNRKVYYFLLP